MLGVVEIKGSARPEIPGYPHLSGSSVALVFSTSAYGIDVRVASRKMPGAALRDIEVVKSREPNGETGQRAGCRRGFRFARLFAANFGETRFSRGKITHLRTPSIPICLFRPDVRCRRTIGSLHWPPVSVEFIASRLKLLLRPVPPVKRTNLVGILFGMPPDADRCNAVIQYITDRGI